MPLLGSALLGPGCHQTPDPTDAVAVDCNRLEGRLTKQAIKLAARVSTKVRTAEDPKICITDLAGEVIVAPVSDDEAATRLEKAMELTQRDLRLPEVVKHAGRHNPVEAGVEKRKLLGPGGNQWKSIRQARASDGEHFGRKIDAKQMHGRHPPLEDFQELARAATDIEDTLPRAKRQPGDRILHG